MSRHFDDWVTIVPAKGQAKEAARALLDLSPDPRDVRVQGNGSEFLVPPELADAYTAMTEPKPARKRTTKREATSAD